MPSISDLPFDPYDFHSIATWLSDRALRRVGRTRLWVWDDSSDGKRFKLEFGNRHFIWVYPNNDIMATCSGYTSPIWRKHLRELTQVEWLYNKSNKRLEVTSNGNSVFIEPTDKIVIRRELAADDSWQYNFVEPRDLEASNISAYRDLQLV